MSGGRKQAELIDRVRYPNPLPLPPYPPKLQRVDISSKRYADGPETQNRVGGNLAINFTDRLARSNQLPVLVDAEGGIPMDLTQFPGVWTGDLDRFAPKTVPDLRTLDLDDEDRFLLTPLSDVLPAGATSSVSNAMPVPVPRKSGAADVTWLRRTEYLASTSGRSTPEHTSREKHERVKDEILHVDTSREAEVARIKETFTAVNESLLTSLRHPTKPHLRAVSSYDFLPDIDTWATNYQVVRFSDWPGRTRAGRPVEDPRVAEALLRPVNHNGNQRVSLYLVTGSDKDDSAMANGTAKQKFKGPAEGVDSDDEGLFGDSDSEGENKAQQAAPEPAAGEGEKKSQEQLDDIAANELAQRRIRGEVVALDEIVDGQAPESAGSEFRFHRDYQAGESNAQASHNQFVIVLTEEGPHAAPASSTAQSDWQARHMTEKGHDSPIVGSGKKRPVAYYHPVAMQYTLRQKRIKRNESARYPDMWASVHASDRAMFDYELRKAWRSRREVDRLDPTLEVDLSDSEPERDELSTPRAEHDTPAMEANKDGDVAMEDHNSPSPARQRHASFSASPGPRTRSPATNGKQRSPAASEPRSESGLESGSESGSDGEADPEEMDDELAALQAEAEGQDDDVPIEGRRRRHRAEEASVPSAPADDQDDEDE